MNTVDNRKNLTMKIVVGRYAMTVEFHGVSVGELDSITTAMWEALQSVLDAKVSDVARAQYTVDTDKTSDLMDELRDHLAEQR
jgi:hypothetical protein